jgi:DNA-binding transcriptional MerR regulator
MAKTRQTAQLRGATPSPELQQRLTQAELLRDARIRSLWPHLEPGQQLLVLDPAGAVGHGYPLTSSELAQLASLTERQVRYWSDNGLIPHWRRVRRRLFEAVGLISAFSIANAKQHELQFYRGLMEEPIDRLPAKLGILANLLNSRLEDAEPEEVRALAPSLEALTRH